MLLEGGLAEKGVNKPVRFLIAGIPNTGKSTVINLLAGGKKAQVGDKAGVTRAKQWVRCGAFELLDTPGTMPPSLADQRHARRLAYLGSVNDDILDREEVALALLEELWEKYPAALAERFDGAKMVVAHLGGQEQWVETAEFLAGKNVYMDTSMATKYCPKDLFEFIVKKHGADKTLFASDSPWSDTAEAAEMIHSCDFTDEDKEKILHGTAEKLLGC